MIEKPQVGDYILCKQGDNLFYYATLLGHYSGTVWDMAVDFDTTPPPRRQDGKLMNPEHCTLLSTGVYVRRNDPSSRRYTLISRGGKPKSLKTEIKELWDPLLKAVAGP